MEKLFVGDGEVKVETDVFDLETRLSVIQALIPLGLEAVADVLQAAGWGPVYAQGYGAVVSSVGKPEGVRVSVGPEASGGRSPCARRRGRYGGFPGSIPSSSDAQRDGREAFPASS